MLKSVAYKDCCTLFKPIQVTQAATDSLSISLWVKKILYFEELLFVLLNKKKENKKKEENQLKKKNVLISKIRERSLWYFVQRSMCNREKLFKTIVVCQIHRVKNFSTSYGQTLSFSAMLLLIFAAQSTWIFLHKALTVWELAFETMPQLEWQQLRVAPTGCANEQLQLPRMKALIQNIAFAKICCNRLPQLVASCENCLIGYVVKIDFKNSFVNHFASENFPFLSQFI